VGYVHFARCFRIIYGAEIAFTWCEAIKAIYPFAGQRAGLLIAEVQSGDELQELVTSLPFAPIVTTEIHPIGTVQGALKTIEQIQRRLAELGPGMVGAR
jgi:hypothetical protein